MGELIKVGMADMNVCKAPDRITTLGLGSCVGVVLYDSKRMVCGMVHVMLPDSTHIKNSDNPAKFADTGVRALVEKLGRMGITKSSLQAKIAGGAQMFAINTQNDLLRIGEKNSLAVKQVLRELGIRLVAEDCGGTFGRTIEFDPENQQLMIRAIGKDSRVI